MDLFLRIVLVILIFFIPFSFAGAEPWAFSVLQGGVGVLLAGLLFSRNHFSISPLFKPVCYTLGFLALYACLQSLFPQTLLMKPAPYPSTLMRLYTLEHASYFVTYLAVVFCLMQLLDSSSRVNRLILATSICAALVTLVAFSFSKGEYIHLFAGKRAGFGPFLNRNHGGIFLAQCTLLWLGWVGAVFASRKSLHSITERQALWAKLSWGAVLLISLGTAAVFSRSRGGMLSLFTGLFCFSSLCAFTVSARWKKRLLYFTIILIFFGAGAYWAKTHTQQINAFAHRKGVIDTSVETRKMMYRAAYKMLNVYPIWGIGIGALPVAITSYTEYSIHAYIERLHSDWLEMYVGMGIIGSLFTLAGLIWFGWLLLRRFRRLETIKKIKLSAITAALVVTWTGAIADFPFFIPATAFLFFLTLGLACSPVFWKNRVRLCRLGYPVKVLFLILFLAACIIPLQKTLAWRCFFFGRNLKPEAKIAIYQKGVSYYPGPRFALKLGNAYYNTARHTSDPAQRALYIQKSHQLAAKYLHQYPKEKELSVLYLRTRPIVQKPSR